MGAKKEAVKEADRVLTPGKPDLERCDNKVISARYSPMTFIPVAITEQFRRFANLYFLIIGCIMAIGYYTPAFESAISPFTTLGPLALVICFSLIVEGSADLKRHRNDAETNNAPCVVLTRTDQLEAHEGSQRDEHILQGKDCMVNVDRAFYADATVSSPTAKPANYVKVSYEVVRRQDIRQGHFVLVKNREMVPADVVLLASSNDGGSAYIETSSIDGETNLKLRTSPNLPASVLRRLRGGVPLEGIPEEEKREDEQQSMGTESIESATKRLTRFSYLGFPNGKSALEHPSASMPEEPGLEHQGLSFKQRMQSVGKNISQGLEHVRRGSAGGNPHGAGTEKYISALTTEPPNPSVHSFSGRLTFPPFELGGRVHDIPLDADNVLLRGAVLRNTEWVIGVAFFTGNDTKLVQNSFKTPSKFSQLDRLMNFTVMAILCIMIACIIYLASMAVHTTGQSFDDLFYCGFSRDANEKWPYLPADFDAPKWRTTSDNWIQLFFLYVTLLNNFVPLSLYVTVEFITFCMLYFVYADLSMYDPISNTRAAARSTIVTDLGRIQYIFSDKTGTLTQNVMRFKRCSVDGMAFGAPVAKSRPVDDDEKPEEPTRFYPLRQLLVGQFKRARGPGLEGLGGSSGDDPTVTQTLTFNAEMFLRVMSLCHTVVVEKDIDNKEHIGGGDSVASSTHSGAGKNIFTNRKRSNTSDSLPTVKEDGGGFEIERMKTMNDDNKEGDGAPAGFAYQAESPDEGALVSAASKTYGFQVVTRDGAGIRVRMSSPSHLQNPRVTDGLKNGTLTLKRIAAETAGETDTEDVSPTFVDSSLLLEPRDETWEILAVNKFDSDRKRMSILLRSPPELGGFPVLFCKGADSSMLEPGVCATGNILQQGDPAAIVGNVNNSTLSTVTEGGGNGAGADDGVDEDGWEMAQVLGMQAHLGDFASEGLRTLVLGMRVLAEKECSDWLVEYNAAATAMKGRVEMLTAAAMKIETNIHIVGATAIEDRLQDQVPGTISTLGKAGIKLWVLTGDKRETAIEIGYSTCVLTPKMHLTEVADNGKTHVRAQLAMEFMRLVKMGKLVEYQRSQLKDTGPKTCSSRLSNCFFSLGKCWRSFRRILAGCLAAIYGVFGCRMRSELNREWVEEQELEEKKHIKVIEKRRQTRETAMLLIQQYKETDEGQQSQRDATARKEAGGASGSTRKSATADRDDEGMDDLSLASEETPAVFNRASSAKGMLKELSASGRMSSAKLREISLATLTVQQAGENEPLIDEETLSMASFFPEDKSNVNDFDKRKRTLLERLFAIDRDVRKGHLNKHLSAEKKRQLTERAAMSERTFAAKESQGPRALVIEGAALKHLLGEDRLEAILFAVASKCDAVIACRVSPQQKALLLNLVRNNVVPEPITLAIGDGANDVGMIQEAHVGVGISGKEGQQAVNASDFAIAQFKFLEDLVLIHGRWDFFRLSSVVLFSFYKNAILAGILIIFSPQVLYSGTPLFDEWLIAMFNFLAGLPIIILGLFDRYLSKNYVRQNPEVYKATRENELITKRTLLRWIVLVFVHIFTIYYFTVPPQSIGGGMTSAWSGLMAGKNTDAPGDGEGGDLKSVGTVTFVSLVFMMAYKVLFESKSLVHGIWPAFTCKKGAGEGAMSRIAYTWHGVLWFSIIFTFFALSVYSLIGRAGPGQFSQYTNVAEHVMRYRSLSWMLMFFVPIAGMVFDVTGKVYANMYFPTQTQIHLEIESKGKILRRRRKKLRQDDSRAEGARAEGFQESHV